MSETGPTSPENKEALSDPAELLVERMAQLLTEMELLEWQRRESSTLAESDRELSQAADSAYETMLGAFAALAKLHPELVGPTLATLVNDERPEVRHAAAVYTDTLYFADPEGNRDLIAKLLLDDERGVRWEAADLMSEQFAAGTVPVEYMTKLPLLVANRPEGHKGLDFRMIPMEDEDALRD